MTYNPLNKAKSLKDLKDYIETVEYFSIRPLTFILNCKTLRLGKTTRWEPLPNKAYIRDLVKFFAYLPLGGIGVLCKSRQMTVSWVVASYVAWCLMTKTNWHGIWASIKHKQAREVIYKRILNILNRLEFPRPYYRTIGDSIEVPMLNNSITAVARGATQVTGDAYNFLALDEFAKIEPAYLQDKVYKEVLPALEYGQTFIISTPQGGTLFQDLYEEE